MVCGKLVDGSTIFKILNFYKGTLIFREITFISKILYLKC